MEKTVAYIKNPCYYNMLILYNLIRLKKIYSLKLFMLIYSLSKLNCEVLHDDLAYEIRWAVAGDSIVLQLVAKLDDREYMSFGISGDPDHSVMIGGDVVVAWVDKETLKGYADDYFLDAKSQCSGPTGSCPDNKLSENSNNIRLLNAAMVNGYSIVTYQRPLRPSDQYDKQILTNQSQPVIWAIGPLNQRDEVSFHSNFNKRDKLVDFGRSAKWNCPMPEGDQPSMKPATPAPTTKRFQEVEETEPEELPTTTTTIRSRNPDHRRRGGSTAASATSNRNQPERETERIPSRNGGQQRRRTTTTTSTTLRPAATPAPVKNRAVPWHIPPIECDEPDDGVFYAQMGPTGGKRGYPAITGHVGWGISWYINGLLIPEVNVVRGKTYTFVVEGGFDPEIPAKYHPFYITDDPIGGYEYKTPEERASVQIYAGARLGKNGNVIPVGVGRLCHWTHKGDSDADDFDSFGAYQRTLELNCDKGEPGVIQWTPDKDTPDTVYYQCFTHRYLGWKINVLDSCDRAGAASEQHEVIVPADEADMDLEDAPSIRVETKINPNDLDLGLVKTDSKKRADILDNKEQMLDVDVTVSEKPKEGEVQLQNQGIFYQELPKVETYVPFAVETKPPTNFTSFPMNKFPPKQFYNPGGKIMFRRPPPGPGHHMMHIPPPPPHFMKQHHHMRPHMHHRLPPPPPHMMKKPYYRQNPMKMPMGLRPVHPMMKYDKPLLMSNRLVLAKPQFLKPNVNVQVPAEIIEQVKHVEVSPEQKATERSAIVQNEGQSQQLVAQAKSEDDAVFSNMRLAVNTGFKPDTVVMENGFRPIMTKEIESRMAEDDLPDIEFESEFGVINESEMKREINHQDELKATEYFEPMFIPSPTIDFDKQTPMARRSDKLTAEEENTEKQQVEEEIASAAAERVESYYLPPDNNKQSKVKPLEPGSPSNNVDVPPGTVVTYDGKKVSGASLTVRVPEQQSKVFESRSSKAAEFIRARPQFLPFKGELPPLDGQFVNARQLQGRGFLNRQLDTPALPIAGGSTKLSPVRNLEMQEDEDSVRVVRNKREAHHTEEHTNSTRQEAKSSTTVLVPVTCYLVVLSTVILNVIF